MASFYVVDGDYLISVGHCATEMEPQQKPGGHAVIAGVPPGFNGQRTPFAGARWHVGKQCWCDTRTEEERAASAVREVLVSRHAAYPPLSEFADAMYWASQGDHAKMEAWIEAVTAVKLRHPKAS